MSFNGRQVDGFGRNTTPTEIANLASLSKAITAVCVLKALNESGRDISVSLDEVIPRMLERFPTRDRRLDKLSVSDLITHTSGLHTAHLNSLGEAIASFNTEAKSWQFEQIVKMGFNENSNTSFYYANSNYLILGLVVEELSKEKYESYCHRTVLKDLGIKTARLSPQWKLLSSFGGWEMSASDYLKFIDAYFREGKVDPALNERISTLVRDDIRYGLGMHMRRTNKGWVFWHAGSFKWKGRAISGNFGAYSALYDNGYSVSINYSKDFGEGRGERLDKLLYKAANF